ncbi:CIA30 family protein [Aliivibrio sp. S3MY1]|uniref:CIA30 family protein n=1 Tax=unclassified Aliivibrio TaxID=2645654 RepID=UPI002378BBBB|nr:MULTISPECIES: CIA30 family protein [unclassified Aliivibrio]MDD9194558.1 CIA30 family protein [Aliivibrio sp. S3MY1]MDD9200607.1 CIA30 family protein [Aliivibrio sp. S2MY1]
MSEQQFEMIDFTQPNEHQKWLATNDNVMGGISIGQLYYDGKTCRFQGELSLENNGGFSSIKRSIESLSKEVNTIELILTGDGHTYQLRLTTWKNGERIQYKHDFTTIKGKQQAKTFHLHNFQAVFRGQLLNHAPDLVADDIKHVGFLITNKQTSPFNLNLAQIQFKTLKNHPTPQSIPE